MSSSSSSSKPFKLTELPPGMRPHPLSDNFRYINLYTGGGGGDAAAANGDDNKNDMILVVALCRPKKRNAINSRMWKEIGQVFQEIYAGSSSSKTAVSLSLCRSVLLLGEGNAFCAGIDVTDLSFFPKTPALLQATGQADNDEKSFNNEQDIDVAHVGLQFLPLLRDMQEAFTALETCPVPVVAAIHGPCIGAGVDLITAADVRMATRDAKFSVREVALGLAADVGTLQRLPKICGGSQSWVREICLTGRDFGAAEAANYGLVSSVPPSSSSSSSQQSPLYKDRAALYQAAWDLCQTMAQHSPIAVRGTKQGLLYARDHSVAEGLEQIAAFNALALQSPEMVRAMMHVRMNPGERFTFRNIPPSSRL